MNITYPVTLTAKGAYKQYAGMREKVEKLIKERWDWIKAQFEIEKDITIVLRPLPNRSTNGTHTMLDNLHKIQLDVSRGCVERIMKTLFHELQHAEQHTRGWLEDRYNNERGRYGAWEAYWKGERYIKHSPGRGQNSLTRYRSQPWEVDANEKADEVLKRYEEQFGKMM